MYSKEPLSSKCNPITKLNENTLPLPLKLPRASLKLNHYLKLRDNTSFSKGNPIVIDDWSVLSLVVQVPGKLEICILHQYKKWAIELSSKIEVVLVKIYPNKSPKKGNSNVGSIKRLKSLKDDK